MEKKESLCKTCFVIEGECKLKNNIFNDIETVLACVLYEKEEPK